MTAVEWARKRNWDKFVLDGVLAQLKLLGDDPVLTKLERAQLTIAFSSVRFVDKWWENDNEESKSTNVG